MRKASIRLAWLFVSVFIICCRAYEGAPTSSVPEETLQSSFPDRKTVRSRDGVGYEGRRENGAAVHFESAEKDQGRTLSVSKKGGRGAGGGGGQDLAQPRDKKHKAGAQPLVLRSSTKVLTHLTAVLLVHVSCLV